MATWHSKTATTWHWYSGYDYAEAENTWEYHTTSDYLNIHTKINEHKGYDTNHPATERLVSFSKEEAVALLETLLDWSFTFDGRAATEKIIDKIRASTGNEF